MRATTGMGLGLIAALSMTLPASATDPYLVQYSRARAYQHFLSSPSPYKTFSTGAAGFTQIQQSPFEYRRLTVTGTYEQQRIHSGGFERYRILPGYEIEQSSPFRYRYVQAPPVESYQFIPSRRRIR